MIFGKRVLYFFFSISGNLESKISAKWKQQFEKLAGVWYLATTKWGCL